MVHWLLLKGGGERRACSPPGEGLWEWGCVLRPHGGRDEASKVPRMENWGHSLPALCPHLCPVPGLRKFLTDKVEAIPRLGARGVILDRVSPSVL